MGIMVYSLITMGNAGFISSTPKPYTLNPKPPKTLNLLNPKP